MSEKCIKQTFTVLRSQKSAYYRSATLQTLARAWLQVFFMAWVMMGCRVTISGPDPSVSGTAERQARATEPQPTPPTPEPPHRATTRLTEPPPQIAVSVPRPAPAFVFSAPASMSFSCGARVRWRNLTAWRGRYSPTECKRPTLAYDVEGKVAPTTKGIASVYADVCDWQQQSNGHCVLEWWAPSGGGSLLRINNNRKFRATFCVPLRSSMAAPPPRTFRFQPRDANGRDMGGPCIIEVLQ